MRIAVVEGQHLTPGDELFSIDPEPYRLAAQEAEARLARVKTDFDTLKSTRLSLGKQIALSTPERRRQRRPTTTARPPCSTAASARLPTSTNRACR